MKPEDPYFSQNLLPLLQESAAAERRRQEQAVKVMELGETFKHDAGVQALDQALLRRPSTFRQSLLDSGGGIRLEPINNSTPISIPINTFEKQCSISLSPPYAYYQDESAPSVTYTTSLLRLEQRGQAVYIAILTARNSLSHDTPLTPEEWLNSVAGLVIPETRDGSFRAFVPQQPAPQNTTFMELDPQAAELVLTQEMQLYIDSARNREQD